MLGRWQPWHGGHTALFEKAWAITNQVAIMVRDVQGVDAGRGNDDNPFNFAKIEENIIAELFMHGYMVDEDFIVMQVPNIVDISYGRGVGYSFTEHDLGKEIHEISATKIRAEMRSKGTL